MESARRWESSPQRRPDRRRNAGTGRRDRRNVSLAPREKRRLVQLCVCAALFLAVFGGRDAVPGGMKEMRGELLQIIQSDTDFRSVFANLGRAVDQGEDGTEIAAQVWRSILGVEENWSPYSFLRRDNPLYMQTLERLSDEAGCLQWPDRGDTPPLPTQEEDSQPGETAETKAPSAAEAEEQAADPLGVGETVAPVVAPVSSGFGLREHPIVGGEKFHNGLDLAAKYGTDITAFSSGVVDYIGESPAYGQYLQIQHANGVTSFYAHCSRLCVQPGQQVEAGEKVAEVGDTGNVTGAHLHFELKVNGELVDPADYIGAE